jgi:hydrogenase-4 membrane subunit HyfE
MKTTIKILAIAVVAAIATGYFFKSRDYTLTGDRIIGIAILALAFIVMPLFIFYRYRNKKVSDYFFRPKKRE